MGIDFSLAGQVAVALCVVAAARRWLSKRRRWLSRIPSAGLRLPFIGNIGLLKASKRGARHEFMVDAVEKSGGDNGITRLSALGMDIVVIGSPAAQNALVKQQPYLPKPTTLYKSFCALGSWSPSMLQLADKEEHARLRTHMNAFFNPANIQSVFSTLRDAVQQMARSINEQHAAGSTTCAEVDATKMSHDLINTVVKDVFFESDKLVNIPMLVDAMAQAGEVLVIPFSTPLLRIGLFPGSKRWHHNWNTLRSTWAEFLEEMYSRELPSNSAAFWACLRRAFPQAMTDKAQYERAIANTALVYAAGTETTASAIASTLAFLATDPPSLHLLEEELRQAGLLATDDQPEPPLATAAALKDLPVLDAIVHENLRLIPPAPGGSRQLTQDMTVCGTRLPKGVTVSLYAFSVHWSSKVWGPDARKWRPQRWLEGTSVAAMKRDASGHLRWMPFLHGPQNCIGQHLAMMELKLAVAVLVSLMHISLDTTKMAARTPDDIVAAIKLDITTSIRGGVHLLMRPRASRT